MKTIKDKNVSKLVTQFTLSNLTCSRANIIGKGWENIRVEPNFYNESINEIVNLLGGREKTKNHIRFVLRNSPVHSWFADRIIYEPFRKCWVYIAGQDYPSEIAQIRKELIK